MNLQKINYQPKLHSGFAILSITLILVVIIVITCLSSAYLQNQRIQRYNLINLYKQSRIKAQTDLDLLYVVLHDNPALLDLAVACPYLFNAQSLTLDPVIKAKYDLNNAFYLCKNTPSSYDIAVQIKHEIGIQDVIVQRKLTLLSGRLLWITDAVVDF